MTGVPYPPNPPENPHLAMDDEFDHAADALTWQEGFAAADSWWRSRLVSDETVEAVAKVIAGPAKCCCDDEAGADLGSEARAAITALVGLVESDRPTGKTGSVSYRVRDRDSDYKAMCHEDRDHAELLLKAWLANGRDAVIERRHVFDGGWLPVGRPFFTGQQERMLDRCEAFDAANPDPETDT